MSKPRKRFGQHFLCDTNIVARIVAALNPLPGEHLIEIGPGQGALTLPVLKRVKALEAIELDRDLIAELRARCEHTGLLHVYTGDVLKFDFAKIIDKDDEKLLRIFGNLPYNISTPLIFHLLTFAPVIADMTFMLQKEVAHRMAAAASSDDFGRLSVMTQYHCQIEVLFEVPPTAFFPPPQVQSSIIHLTPHREYPAIADDYALFATVVKTAFGQRRKTIRNSLKKMVDADMWKTLSIAPELRPENLTVQDFVQLSNHIAISLRQ